MTDIVIAGALRPAIGKFGGTLAKGPAPERGAGVIRSLLAPSGIPPDQISQVIPGRMLTAGSGKRQGIVAVRNSQFHNKRKEENHHGG